MAISQSQADKSWQDSPATATPILSADLKAMSKSNRDLRWMVPSGVTSIDEFDDDSLDAAWVRVDSSGTPAANAVWTEKGDALSGSILGGDSTNAVHGLVRPLSGAGGAMAPGDAFVTSLHLFGSGSSFTMAGIILSDTTTAGSGAQIWANSYLATTGATTYNLWEGANWAATGTRVADATFIGNVYFMRLVCVSATTWRCDVSPDGIGWIAGAAVLTKTFTPTHVGLMLSSWGSATKGVAKFDFMRRVSGVS